jgi:uncharacterized membrane protein
VIISVHYIFALVGLIMAVIAGMSLRDRENPRRVPTALFWGLYALVFLFGDVLLSWLGKPLTHKLIGAGVILLALIAGFGGVRMGKVKEATPEQKRASAERLRNKVFLPALLIPLVTVIGTVGLKSVKLGEAALLDPKHMTLVSFGLACACALIAALWLTRETPAQAAREGRRLLDSIGWAAVLPQLLATLGGVFVAAKVGDAVATLVTRNIPDQKFVLVVAYGAGMALFTMIMGNAFAAFPVMTAGIAVPLLIRKYGADPAPLVAIGMYAGYCGTLMTPMAANFNIVPAALLDLRDRNGVIKAQIPTAIPLLLTNILLMYFIAFR